MDVSTEVKHIIRGLTEDAEPGVSMQHRYTHVLQRKQEETHAFLASALLRMGGNDGGSIGDVQEKATKYYECIMQHRM